MEEVGGVMKDKLSALMDGELDGRTATPLINELGHEGEARETWIAYHLIGDAMRDTRVLSEGFSARFARRLAEEPTVLAPKRLAPRFVSSNPWLAMPAAVAASLAGVALVGWLAFAPQAQQQGVPVATANSSAPRIETRPQRIPLPTATPDYLLAHQGFSPRLSLEGMAPYARTVSDQAVEGRR